MYFLFFFQDNMFNILLFNICVDESRLALIAQFLRHVLDCQTLHSALGHQLAKGFCIISYELRLCLETN